MTKAWLENIIRLHDAYTIKIQYDAQLREIKQIKYFASDNVLIL